MTSNGDILSLCSPIRPRHVSNIESSLPPFFFLRIISPEGIGGSLHDDALGAAASLLVTVFHVHGLRGAVGARVAAAAR